MNRFTMAAVLGLSSMLPVSVMAEDMLAPSEMHDAAEAAELGEVVKLAYIDPLSGPFASVGDAGLTQMGYEVDRLNAHGGLAGHRIEITGYDNKTNPQESLVQLQKAIDDGARIIVQGNGSSVAHALVDAIDKHNRRNPGDEVMYLNYGSVDPALTNDACSYWHFRFDANTDMKISAYADWLVTQPDITSVYVIGQDYSHGRAVAAAVHRELEAKRPDIEIVGDELHPIGRVQDFSPYVQKILSSDADAIITGNWGTDMTLLIKAVSDAGLDIPVLTFYAGGLGSPTAMGESALGRVKQITESHENVETTPERIAMYDYFEDTLGFDYYYGRVTTMMDMLQQAGEEAGSVEVPALADALDGMTYDGPFGTVTMRADDHQLMQPLYISTVSDAVDRDAEGTGMGFATDIEIAPENTALETTCEMRRPG